MEMWAIARERFKASAEHLSFITGDEITGVEAKEHDISDTFVFEPAPPGTYRQLIVEISTPKRLFNTSGKQILESKKQLSDRGVASPDHADALIMSLVPTEAGTMSRIVNPIIETAQRGFPELAGGPVGQKLDSNSTAVAGGMAPAVPTGKRFDRDFARDW